MNTLTLPRLLSFLLLVLAAACDEDKPDDTSETPTTVTAAASGQVTVAAEGTRFDPAVTSTQIPSGVWMCDMNGSVHYAALERGDGECPVCGMNLVQKSDHEMGDEHSMGNHEMGDEHSM